jgi:hypothetical protein
MDFHSMWMVSAAELRKCAFDTQADDRCRGDGDLLFGSHGQEDQRGKGSLSQTPIAPDDIVFSPALIAASSFGGDGKYFQVATKRAGNLEVTWKVFCWSCAVGNLRCYSGKINTPTTRTMNLGRLLASSTSSDPSFVFPLL